MLTELYRYALDKGLAAQPGFKPKRVKAYVLLSASGEFLGIHTREKDAPAVYAPDIGAAANGTRYCNPLIEKAKIPLGMVEDPKGDQNVPTKHDFFLSMLDDGGRLRAGVFCGGPGLAGWSHCADNRAGLGAA